MANRKSHPKQKIILALSANYGHSGHRHSPQFHVVNDRSLLIPSSQPPQHVFEPNQFPFKFDIKSRFQSKSWKRTNDTSCSLNKGWVAVNNSILIQGTPISRRGLTSYLSDYNNMVLSSLNYIPCLLRPIV